MSSELQKAARIYNYTIGFRLQKVNLNHGVPGISSESLAIADEINRRIDELGDSLRTDYQQLKIKIRGKDNAKK